MNASNKKSFRLRKDRRKPTTQDIKVEFLIRFNICRRNLSLFLEIKYLLLV